MIASIEAMMCGLPLVLHDAPLFKWAAAGALVRHVNMASPGELRRAVEQALRNGAGSTGEEAMKRFSWDSLIPDYIRMYERVFHENSLTE